MGYINVFVSKDAKISVKNNQLTLSAENELIDYPLEDMNSLMIENTRAQISTYALSKLAQYGILTFICDESHLPCGVVLPFCQHYQTLSCFEKQNILPKPLQKQLWKKIIINKINNQNEVLNICGGNNSLTEISKIVLSGDSSNCEAKASLIYFPELFGKAFKRRDDNESINSFLNYGYSIIRGFVARSVVAHGLQPFLGINHKNQYNQFNLADDLMEVFRPIVDLFVKTILTDELKLTSEIKGKIYGIINYEIEVDGQKQAISHAIDMFVQSFVKSVSEQKDYLKEIKITGLNWHNYE